MGGGGAYRQRAYMITASIFEGYTHTTTHATAKVNQTKKIYIKTFGQKDISPQAKYCKILTKFQLDFIAFIDFNGVYYFKLGHVAFICDRRRERYHTVKEFLAKEHLMIAVYG